LRDKNFKVSTNDVSIYIEKGYLMASSKFLKNETMVIEINTKHGKSAFLKFPYVVWTNKTEQVFNQPP
jgi:non-canonical (house-cleaning) NTP pyrophosphatase